MGLININQEEFNQFFREVLDKYKNNVRIIDNDFSNYQILNGNGEWLFEVNYDPENYGFWYSLTIILPLFEEKFGIDWLELNVLMKPVLEQDFKLVVPEFQELK